ncbi:MAG TPA: 4-alpha-glucanotransferase, partial [Polyangiaceae bacterium]
MLPSLFDERSSGILLHPTSLPGPHGSGDLGVAAHRFAEFLARSGQRWWQMLPVGPPGAGYSPYDTPSSFAGSPLLVSLELLARDGLLDPRDLGAPRRMIELQRCHYAAANRFRIERLRRAFETFRSRSLPALQRELEAFRERARGWLPGFSLFCALKGAHRGRHWSQWEPELALRKPEALSRARRELETEVGFQEFVQFAFDRQWNELKEHCRDLGVRLLGDVPMFVAHDGADVWEHRDIFQLDDRGERRVVAGVPPDYFSAEGQLWGNPLYDWDALKERGYDWWIQRLQGTLARFDAVRIDHFIAFHRYWEIPAWASTAREGRFVLVPGVDFFEKLREKIGGLPFIAEDLGLVTPEVQALRDRFELPGMRVLEFAFGGDAHDYQPHRYPRRTVVYTGTHDNDTLVGWLGAAERTLDPAERARLEGERKRALAYAGSDGREPHWDFIRLALSSVANTALFPLQDVLGQGTESRMNVPGTAFGNWTYRCKA